MEEFNNYTSTNFIEEKIIEDLKNARYGESVHTRFPPEPNGYLHIGHAKSICLNFGVAKKFNGKCNLRFDDTNPTTEDTEYVDSIQEDVRWLGFDWEDRMFYASNYFENIYNFAEQLINKGLAFVCDLTAEEIGQYRGTPTIPGKESPFRNRTPQENLELFRKMRAGEFADGSHVLRAKIDMASPNMNLRDPVLYRIKRAHHHRTGDAWCIYPMYDFAHGYCDALEGITHSICTLEFEIHRPLYEWLLEVVELEHRPQQIEFARLNLSYTVMSKRKLLQLVTEGHVNGWDDPRMPTIAGLRRRGYTPQSIRTFAEKIGVAKRDNLIDVALLEFSIREDLNKTAPRVMGVLKPLKVVIVNYPENETEMLEAVNNPEDPAMGTRSVPFSRELYIEQDDFREVPPPKYFRLVPGGEVRLRWAYFIKCVDVIKDAEGNVTEVHCTYDPASKGGNSPDGRKVKGTIHWVSAKDAIDAEVRIYDRLFVKEDPTDIEEGEDFKDFINPNSLEVLSGAKLEPSLKSAQKSSMYQFERHGYFCVDSKDSSNEKPVFNRTVSLKDTWAKIAGK